MTKKPRKGAKGANISPFSGKARKEKSAHSDPKRPSGRSGPPKGEDPRKKKPDKGDDGE